MSPEAALPTKRRRTHTPKITRERVRDKYRWLVSGLYINGKRDRKYFPTRAAADAYLEDQLTRIKNLGDRGASIPAALVEDALRAFDILKPLGTSLETAARYFQAAEARKTASKPVRDVVVDFLANRKNLSRSPRHLHDLKHRLDQFAKAHGDTLASEISTRDIDAWLGKLSKNYAPISVINFRRITHNLFGFAVARGFASANPVSAVEIASVKKTPPGIFCPAELRAILHAADVRIVPALAIGAFAGLRTAEIERLSWGDVKLSRGTIEVAASKSKTAQRRLVTIQPNLAAFLAPYASHSGQVRSFSAKVYGELRAAAFRAAGFGEPGSETKAERAIGITLREAPTNGLRHSFASYRLAATNDAARTALELGHTSNELLFSTYRELVTEEDAAAFWSIFPEDAAGRNVLPFTPQATTAA